MPPPPTAKPPNPISADVAAIEARVTRGEIKQAAEDARALLERTERAFGPDAAETAEAILVHTRLQLLDSSTPRPDLEPLAQRGCASTRTCWGPDDPKVGVALERLSLIAQRAADFPRRAQRRNGRLQAITRAFGPEDPRTLSARTGQASLLRDQGQFADARRIYEELATYERTGGGTPAKRIDLLNNLGTVLVYLGEGVPAQQRTGTRPHAGPCDVHGRAGDRRQAPLNLGGALAMQAEFPSAASRIQEAIPIFEKREGPDGPNVMACVANLGLALESLGDPMGALPYVKRSLAGSEKAFGPDHPRTLSIKVSLASILIELGQTEEARPLLEGARSALTAAFGADNPKLLWALGASARLELADGNYPAARRFAELEIAISESTFALDSANRLVGLGDAVEVYLELGNLDEARKLSEKMIRFSDVGGSKAADLPSAYRVLAGVERRAGDPAAAMRAVDHAIEATGNFAELDATELPYLITERARILAARGDLTKAAEEMRKGLGALEQRLGPTHPAATAARLDLADLLARTRRPSAAKPLYEQALASSASLYGERSIVVATQRNRSAEFRALHGHRSDAVRMALADAATIRDAVRGTARYLTEREALAFEIAHRSGLDVALWVLGQPNEPGSAAGQVWDEVIRSRAVILDEMATRHKLSLHGADPDLPALVRRAAAARERLARLAAGGSEAPTAARFRAAWDHAVQDRDQIEREIAAKTAGRAEGDRNEPGWRDIADHLRPEDAVVAYVQHGALPSPLSGPASAEYLAFVLRPGARSPSVVPIGPAVTVDALVAEWREAVAKAPPTLSGATGRRSEVPLFETGRALRRMVWDPVATKLRGADRVFVVPDGAMNLVNLAALPDDVGGYLVESGPLLHLLSTERDLLEPPHRSPAVQGLLAVGGVDFDAKPLRAEKVDDVTNPAARGEGGEVPGAPPSCEELRALR
jgi:tetratricopeptide (TPR) repeat protein